ncbi:MAG: hypothetical protein AAGD25_28345 [Cyanobacteria bacterium P01_F01_bin.150]
MAFLVLTEWPQVPVEDFVQKGPTLEFFDPTDGLWFRALGMGLQGQAINAEIWHDILSFRRHRDGIIERKAVQAQLKSYGITGPNYALRYPITTAYPGIEFRNFRYDDFVAIKGAITITILPDIRVHQYQEMIENVMVRDLTADSEVLFFADSPFSNSDWLFLWISQNNKAEALHQTVERWFGQNASEKRSAQLRYLKVRPQAPTYPIVGVSTLDG